jgi:hypothetical protein
MRIEGAGLLRQFPPFISVDHPGTLQLVRRHHQGFELFFDAHGDLRLFQQPAPGSYSLFFLIVVHCSPPGCLYFGRCCAVVDVL